MGERVTVGEVSAGWAESRALTGLRGVGALLVMAHHFYLHLAIQINLPFFEPLLRRGYLGVDLFFVLSGFVLSMVYGEWFDGSTAGGARYIPVFLVRRVARLWPLHAGMLVVMLIAGLWAFGGPVPVRVILANVAMVQGWGFSTEINAPAWSISTEFLVYLLFPLLAGALLRPRLGFVLGVAIVVGALAVCMRFAPPLGLVRRGYLDVYYNYSLLPVMRSVAGFCLGMLAWRAGQVVGVRRVFARGWVGPCLLAAFFGLLLGRVHDLVVYPLLPLVVLGMHYGQGRLCQVFAVNPLYRLGVLSYAVYLIHFALLVGFPLGWGPAWAMLLVYLGMLLGLAMVAHAVVERPGRYWIRRWGEGALARLMPPGVAPLRDSAGSPM